MGEHFGIAADEKRRVENLAAVAASGYLELCAHCNGTGNELYAMYRRCPKCGGDGVVETEQVPPAGGVS